MDIIGGYKDEQKARAEQWIPGMLSRVPEITSADKAYQWLRDNDSYVPRAYVREVWGEIIRGAERIDIVNRLAETDIIPRDWMTPTSFEYGSEYNYIVKLSGVDMASGDLREEYTTVSSQVNLTIEEIQGRTVDAALRYGFATIDPTFDISFDSIKWRPEAA